MFNDPALNVGANAMAAAYPYLSLHTAGTVTDSTSESTAARQPAGWAAATGGDLALTAAVPFTGGAAAGPVVRVGYWSAATGGTYGGDIMIAAGSDLSFNAAGEYTVESITETGASS